MAPGVVAAKRQRFRSKWVNERCGRCESPIRYLHILPLLVQRIRSYHHDHMSLHTKLTCKKATEQLDDREIHLWWMPYTREQGRGPLLTVLGRYLGTDSGNVVLEIGEHGRPALDKTQDDSLDFNWSHSGAHAVIAIGRNVSLGIDVERVRERPKALALARRYFAEDEIAVLAQLRDAERSAAFLDLWTAKEAVLKATGRGIAFGLHRLTISSEPDSLVLKQLDDDNATDWQLYRLPLHPDYVAALAWRGGYREIKRRHL